MSRTYSVTAHLDLAFSKEIVWRILAKAEDIGCLFFLRDLSAAFSWDQEQLKLEEAIDILLYNLPDPTIPNITLELPNNIYRFGHEWR